MLKRLPKPVRMLALAAGLGLASAPLLVPSPALAWGHGGHGGWHGGHGGWHHGWHGGWHGGWRPYGYYPPPPAYYPAPVYRVPPPAYYGAPAYAPW